MRAMKNWIGLIGALLPVLFCGGFLLYFSKVRGAFGGLVDRELGPTMVGLGAFFLLFLVLFLVKLWRFSRPPASSSGPGGRAAAPEEAPHSDFDADAALARYLARRADIPPAERPITPVVRTVAYADLERSSAAGRSRLERRIEAAVRDVCGAAPSFDLARRSLVRDCIAETRANVHLPAPVAAELAGSR